MNDPSKSRVTPTTTDFGIFYPVGYLVAAFPEQVHAERVKRDLITGGYDEGDVQLYSCEEVTRATEQNLSQAGILAHLGKSDQAIRIHLQAAQQGASFLLIYAPGDTETARAMNVVRRGPFNFVHRYHRLAIEEVK